jgi:hypothetical protein
MTMIWGYYSSVVVRIFIFKLMITLSIINKKELLVHEFIPLLPTYCITTYKLWRMYVLEEKFSSEERKACWNDSS